MFSLQRFLSHADKFFDLLEASAEEARRSVQALVELINKPRDGQTPMSSSSGGGRTSALPRR